MPKLVEKATGREWDIPSDDLSNALSSGLYEVPEGATATVVDPRTSLPADVPAEQAATDVELHGYRPETSGEFRERENVARIEREQGGVAGALKTAAESTVDAASFGGYGALADLLFGDDYTERRRERRQAHEYIATGGDVVGSVAPIFFTGGAGAGGALARATPVALAERAGLAVERRVGGGLLGLAARGGTEAGLQAIGSTVQELVLDDQPITAERAVSALSNNLLYAGAIGIGAPIVGKALEKGLVKAGRAVDDVAGRLGRLGEHASPGEAVVDGLRSYRQAVESANPYIAAEGEAKKVLTTTKGRLRYALDNAEGLAQRPGQVLDSLQREAQALKRAVSEGEALSTKLASQDAKLVETLGERLASAGDAASIELDGRLARSYANYSGEVLGKGRRISVSVEALAGFREALSSGAVQGRRAQSLAAMHGLIDQNRALQTTIQAATEAQAAGGTATTLLGKGIKSATSAGMTGLGFAVGGPLGGWMGSKLGDALSDLVVKRVGKATGQATSRATRALDSFLTAAAPIARAAPLAATKILSSTSFGQAEPTRPQAKVRDPLVATFRAREAEIYAQTTIDPSGSLRMRPQARAEIARRLTGVRAVSPLLADRMETVAARRLEYLARKLPKRPDAAASAIGPERWQPSTMQIASFARTVAAVEDPAGVIERLSDASMTPEDAEALREVYPELFAQVQSDLVARLPELRQSLPYAKRLMLSIMTGVPVDPSMRPEVLRQLQASFATEPGTNGGTEAPKAQPAFGSVSKPEPTAAQQRAG